MSATQAVTASTLGAVSTGHFVWTGDKYCIGKVTALNKGRSTVRLTFSLSSSDEREYDRSQLERAYLSPHTRVYVSNGALTDDMESLLIGRVINYSVSQERPLEYLVRFPNQNDHWIAEADLEVRCMLPKLDPTDVLASGGIESQFLHDRRLAVLRALAGARAVGRGLTGLISSSVVLVPHQIDVVRRVLEDPVQRYLLADEVGMGKTID